LSLPREPEAEEVRSHRVWKGIGPGANNCHVDAPPPATTVSSAGFVAIDKELEW